MNKRSNAAKTSRLRKGKYDDAKVQSNAVVEPQKHQRSIKEENCVRVAQMKYSGEEYRTRRILDIFT